MADVPPIPTSYMEVLNTFGDIRKYIRGDGTISPKWEQEKIVRIQLPAPIRYAFDETVRISRITVHKDLAAVAEYLFRDVWAAGLVEVLGPYGGGYIFRSVRDRHSISLHSFGIAWDFDPETYPLGSLKKRDPRLVAIFEKWGFLCGENFHNRKDPQHFQYARNC